MKGKKGGWPSPFFLNWYTSWKGTKKDFQGRLNTGSMPHWKVPCEMPCEMPCGKKRIRNWIPGGRKKREWIQNWMPSQSYIGWKKKKRMGSDAGKKRKRS